ncbi:MAG: hypothetical protein AAGE18_02375 [Pseudomonadota bacterium]
MLLLGQSGRGEAGTLAVFSDVNMFDAAALAAGGPAGNSQVLANLLGGGTRVLYSTQTGSSRNRLPIVGAFRGMSGVRAGQTRQELSAARLAGVDLLMLDIGFRRSNPYSASEIAAAADFLANGGTIGLIAELTPSSAADLAGLNALLAGLNSTIRYETAARRSGGRQFADTIMPTTLTAGVTQFSIGAANPLSAGNRGLVAVQNRNYTFAAFEPVSAGTPISVVPLPAGLPLALSAFALLGLLSLRRRRAA